MAEDDNWDDLVLTDDAFTLPPPTQTPTPTPTLRTASCSTTGTIKCLNSSPREEESAEDWDNDFDCAPLASSSGLSSLATRPPAASFTSVSSSSSAGIHFVPGSAAALAASGSERLSKEESDQSSTDSSRGGTIKSLLESFAGLSLASPTLTADSLHQLGGRTSSSDSLASAFASGEETVVSFATPRPSGSRTTSSGSSGSKTWTVRRGSALSQLLASVTSGPGRAIHLGSTAPGRAKPADDWDEDLDLDSAPAGSLLGLPSQRPEARERVLRGKASFASHISDDPDEDERLMLPTPKSSRKNPPEPVVLSLIHI